MFNSKTNNIIASILTTYMLVQLVACNASSAENTYNQAPPSLPVITVTQQDATVQETYSASLEGSKDIEIRPQVDGYIEAVYVDEGARVTKGQTIFRINDRIYREQLAQAKAAVAAARANQAAAQINVSKLTPLVQANIVSEVQLKSAQAAYDAASAQVAQAQAMVRNAQVNIGYTVIKAPANGYIGRIPMKTGSLVGMSTPEPLTVLSELSTVYAYFSLSEQDFIRFKQQFPGATVEEKISKVPPVTLVLADETVYPQKGKLEIVSGQFNNTTGSITFRAAFPNLQGTLRSGNTGKVQLPLDLPSSYVIPQEATFELQDKVFVFVVGDSNKVSSVPIAPIGRSRNYYFVKEGLKPGSRIVFSGLDRLKEGAIIQPQAVSIDSILKRKPL